MIGISTWCQPIIPKAARFPKVGSFPRSPAATSGRPLLSCSRMDLPACSSPRIHDAACLCDGWTTLQLLNSVWHCHGLKLGFLLFSILARGASWIRRLMWFFRKGPRWTEVIFMDGGLGPPNLPLFWGAWSQVSCWFTLASLYVMGKYSGYTQLLSVHVCWVGFAALGPVLNVRAKHGVKPPYLPTQTALWLPGAKAKNLTFTFVNSSFGATCKASS